MKLDFINILYTLGIGIIGYFTRDVYNLIKRKYFKGEKPKVILKYSYRHFSTHGSNPRLYGFTSKIIIQNIDLVPLYNIRLVQKLDDIEKVIRNIELLSPTEKIEINNEKEVEYGSIGDNIKEAEQQLPDNFTSPNLILYFKDKNGHKFKSVLNK